MDKPTVTIHCEERNSPDDNSQNLLALDENNCLICNVKFSSDLNVYNISNSYPFKSNTEHESTICDKLSNLLDINLKEQKLHSDSICNNCLQKVKEFESLKSQLKVLKENLNKLYQETCEKYSVEKERYIYLYLEKPKVNKKQSKGIITEEGIIIPNPITKDLSKNNKYFCNVCDSQFESASVLNDHFLTHSNDKSFKCYYCSEIFLEEKSLKFHLKFHKPFHCERCDKSFTEKFYYNEHQLIHTGEKPFSCSKCPKKFIRKKDYKVHFKTHSDDKPFECTICNKTFALKSRLNRHSNIHLGIKPFACEFCSKQYSRNDDLIIHRRSHTGDLPFQCTYCPKRFTNQSNCISHMRTHKRKVNNNLVQNSQLKETSKEKSNIDARDKTVFYTNNECSSSLNSPSPLKNQDPFIIVTEDISSSLPSINNEMSPNIKTNFPEISAFIKQTKLP